MIELRKLAKKFGNSWVVNGVSMKIEEKSLLGLIGPNGSGKTTLLRIITSAILPDEGEILFDGKPPKEIREFIGYVPQFGGFYEEFSVRDNLKFYADLYGVSSDRVDFIIKLLELEEDKIAGYLSGGNKRLLSLGCAMVHDPKYLILDEPLAGVDARVRLKLWTILSSMVDAGKTIIITTHELSEAHNCTHIALLIEGKVSISGTPEQLLSHYNYPVFDILSRTPTKVEELIKEVKWVKWWTRNGREIRVIIPPENEKDMEALLKEKKIDCKFSETRFNLNDFFVFKVKK